MASDRLQVVQVQLPDGVPLDVTGKSFEAWADLLDLCPECAVAGIVGTRLRAFGSSWTDGRIAVVQK